jgi:DMSO reductase family type II enzyme chaperone
MVAPMLTVEPQSQEARAAAARSKLYKSLQVLFAFPDAESFELLGSGWLASCVAELSRDLPYRPPEPPALTPGELSDVDTYAAEFIRIFEVSVGGPPCPLSEGLYFDDRQKKMEELIRFYDYFDLRIEKPGEVLMDHILVELDFMHYLTFREADALVCGKDPAPYRYAQRDFLERHLLKWVPKMLDMLRKAGPPPVFVAMGELLMELFAADHSHVSSVVGSRSA